MSSHPSCPYLANKEFFTMYAKPRPRLSCTDIIFYVFVALWILFCVFVFIDSISDESIFGMETIRPIQTPPKPIEIHIDLEPLKQLLRQEIKEEEKKIENVEEENVEEKEDSSDDDDSSVGSEQSEREEEKEKEE